MALASMTKLMTSIAAIQCVERGLWKLDDDVASILPELAALPVLDGFDEAGKAKLHPRQKIISLRFSS